MKAAYTTHTALLLHRMTHNQSTEVRGVNTIRLQARNGFATYSFAGYFTRQGCPPTPARTPETICSFYSLPHTTQSSPTTPARKNGPRQSSAGTSTTAL